MPLVFDTFTGTAATALTAHTGETGARWPKSPVGAYASGTTPSIDSANRLRSRLGVERTELIPVVREVACVDQSFQPNHVVTVLCVRGYRILYPAREISIREPIELRRRSPSVV